MAALDDIEDMDTPERLAALKQMLTESIGSTEEARRQSEIDLDYYHGRQWTSAEISELKKRRQPVVTFNAIRNKIESICGVEEQSDTDPRAWPRTPNDEQAAQVATDTLRYVCDLNRFGKTRIDVLRDELICGTGGAIVEVEQSAGRFDIKIRKLRWETIVIDPYSREPDFSDARYLGCMQWMDEAGVIALYGENAREAVEGAMNDASLVGAGSYEDRPNEGVSWIDPKRKRVLIVEIYNRTGKSWRRSVFTGFSVISDQISPYKDADGTPCCPIEMISAYVDRDNRRYGEVRDMRSPQDEINHRRSKLLHLMNTRQTYRKDGTIAGSDPQAMRRELNKPDGDIVISKNATWGQDIGIIDKNSEMAGQSELMQGAEAYINRQGANQALMGRGTENQSGRAILAQQQAGLQTLATVLAGHGDWVLRIYRQIWGRARQFWTAPMFIRVTDDLDSPKFIRVNEPVVDQFGMPVFDPQTGQPAMNNRIAEMDVDLIVDRVPASANIQQEEFATLVDLAQKTGIAESPDVKIALVSASSLRPGSKKTIIEALQKPMQPDPQQVAMMVRKAMAEIAKDESQAAKNAADATHTQAETQLMGLQAAQQQVAMMPMQPQAMPQIPPDLPPVAQPMLPDQGQPIQDQPQPPPQGGFLMANFRND